MAMTEKDIKLLWGRAAERCSFPECRMKLTQDNKAVSESFPLGEQAHIVGETEKAPRGRSLLTDEERNSYFNRILLCPNHHTVIDKNPNDYPGEKLHLMKDQHEYWVERSLSETKDSVRTAQELVYADLIDAAVESCQLDTWDKWASRAASLYMQWDTDATERLFRFQNKILGAIWPNTLPQLECSLRKLAYELQAALNAFGEHCETDRGDSKRLVEVKFYHIREWNTKLYDELFKEYEEWHEECENHMREATKAVNWFADAVRGEINPSFFATKGKFFLMKGPYSDLGFRSYFFEFTEGEKQKLLRSCQKRLFLSGSAPKRRKAASD